MEIFGLRVLPGHADVIWGFCQHQPGREKEENLHVGRGDGQGRGSLERERVGVPLQKPDVSLWSGWVSESLRRTAT